MPLRLRLARSLALAAPVALVASLGLGHPRVPAAAAATTPPPAPATTTTAPAPATVTVSPAPGSRTAPPGTQISFLGVAPSAIGQVVVTGSKTGRHRGRLEAYANGEGASFVPARPFESGETVTVTTHLAVAGTTGGTFHFLVAHLVPVTRPVSRPALRTSVPGVRHFVSRPDLEPPTFKVTEAVRKRGPQDFFITPKGKTGQAGPMIVGPTGKLVWYHPLQGDVQAFDLNVQRYLGQRVLTWWQGRVVDGHGVGEDVIDSTSYKTLAVVHTGNGEAADLHEFRLAPHGVALVTAFQGLRWNLSSVGGSPHGTVLDGIVQEIDVRTGLVMFQWDSLDHVPLNQSYAGAPKNPNRPYDYFHVNSIQQLSNGDLLVSARNTSAAYRVSLAEGGKVLWRLGGLASTFRLGPHARFHNQHNVRMRPNGTITIFDDEGRNGLPTSRAIVLKIDRATNEALLLHAYSLDPGLAAKALGNVQVLPGGDLMVAWGTTPVVSQFDPAGRLMLKAVLPKGDDTYRAYRYRWHGTPRTTPALAARPGPGGSSELYASWNGATGVARWQVLAGPSAGNLAPAETVADTGFETRIALRAGPAFARVEAVGSNGRVLSTSPVVALPKA